MIEILNIIAATPFWVWLLLIYLLFVGIRSSRQRVIYLPKLFIAPLIFLGIKYKAFLSQDSIWFCLAILVGITIGFLSYMKSTIEVISDSMSVKIPGSYSTLLIFIIFFLLKYYFGYLESANKDLATKYLLFEVVISGLFSGYFLGKAIFFSYKFLVEKNRD